MLDKLVDSAQLDANLSSVANAIRTKGGTSDPLSFPAGFVSAVQDIPTGDDTTLKKLIDRTITSIVVPDGTTKIGASIFVGCSLLQNVTLPNGITEIGNYAFQGCTALQYVDIPSSVQTIRVAAFTGCTELNYIRFNRAIPANVINANAWNNIPSTCVIVVPAGSLNAYKTAANYPDPAIYTYVEDSAA